MILVTERHGDWVKSGSRLPARRSLGNTPSQRANLWARLGAALPKRRISVKSGPQYQGLTRKSMNVPLSNFTLLFSELNTEACDVLDAVDNFKFEIPTTPCVFAVMDC
jgi:hypothetical protein